ncbi:hypothetical protein ACSLPA_22060, partial [Escherichia coli]
MKKVWLNRYPADVPTEINPDRYQSLVDMFEQSVARYADQPAFVNMGEAILYQLHSLLAATALGFCRLAPTFYLLPFFASGNIPTVV